MARSIGSSPVRSEAGLASSSVMVSLLTRHVNDSSAGYSRFSGSAFMPFHL